MDIRKRRIVKDEDLENFTSSDCVKTSDLANSEKRKRTTHGKELGLDYTGLQEDRGIPPCNRCGNPWKTKVRLQEQEHLLRHGKM